MTRDAIDNDPTEILSGVEGQSVSLVDAAYGNELVVGFGPTHTVATKVGPLLEADWMFYSRETPWLVDTSRGVIATSRDTLNDRRLRALRNALLENSVTKALIRNSLQALTFIFSNDASLILAPREGASQTRPSWVLSTPTGYVLAGVPKVGLRAVSSDAPFKFLVNQQEPPTERMHVPAKPHSEEVARQNRDLVTQDDFLTFLESVAALAGSQVFQPSQPYASSVDALIVAPDGRAVIIEVKTSRRELEPVSLRLPRLIIAMEPLTGNDKIFEQSAGRVRIIEFQQTDERQLARLVRELAEVA